MTDNAPMSILRETLDHYCYGQPTELVVDRHRSALSTVLTVDDYELAVKVPDNGPVSRESLAREALYLCMVSESSDPPPLSVPEMFDCGDLQTEPYYLAMQKVPGVVLDHESVRSFNADEKRALGTGIGAFAAWMSQTLSPEAYQCIVEQYSSARGVYDRTSSSEVIRYWGMRGVIDAHGYTVLATVLEDALCELPSVQDRSQASTYIGHDDLRFANMSFELDTRTGNWLPSGVFDFDLMKPLTAEREFRHLRLIGHQASQAAIEEFECITGQQLSKDDVEFWAKYQLTTATAYLIGQVIHASPEVNTAVFQSSLLGNIETLREMYSEEDGYDWSELDRISV